MKKFIIPGAIILVIIGAITFKLIANKQTLDKARQPVDRSNIPVSVNIAPVERKTLAMKERYPATIEPMEEAKLYAETSGLIAHLSIDLGTVVKQGQGVGWLDTRLLKLNLKDAEIARDKAADDYARAKDLYENNAGLKVDMLNAQTQYDKAQNQVSMILEQIDHARIKAPISGVVYSHTIKEGEFVNPGSPIAMISNIFSLKATVYVTQESVYTLTLGQQAAITTPVLAGESFMGHIIYISPVADANHNYQVDLKVQQTEQTRLRGGTDVQVTFTATDEKEVLKIPKAALMTDTEEPYVFTVEDKKAVTKPVKTGMIDGDDVVVLAGLHEGEQVVTTGQINLKEGNIVEIIN